RVVTCAAPPAAWCSLYLRARSVLDENRALFPCTRARSALYQVASLYSGDVMRKHLSFALVLALATTAACRDTSSGGDDTPMPDGSTPGDDVTIQEIQNDAMSSGTPVTVRGVVVVAVDAFGDRTGDLFVGEPEGGAFSGVKVFNAP